MEFIFQKIPIACPKCRQRAFYYDGITKNIVRASCKRCKVLVSYNPVTKRRRIYRLPERQCSSGVTFW